MSNGEEVVSNMEITTEKTGAEEELITKREAIWAVTGARLPDSTADGVPIANGKRSVTDCIRRIRGIPAADVRPVVRGKWSYDVDDGWDCYGLHCDQCGAVSHWPEFNFCFNCGADMREERAHDEE